MGSQTSEVRLREGDQDGGEDCVPAPRADGCRLAASSSVCGSPERAADGRGGAPGALKQARDVAGALCGCEERRGVTSGSRSSGGAPGSLSITDSCGLARGHPGIDPRRCRPLDPHRCDSAPKPSWCATREIAPASFPVSTARWPTRRTACSFSPAVSLGDDGPFARPLPVPVSGLCCHGSSLHPRRGPPGEPVGLKGRRRTSAKTVSNGLYRQGEVDLRRTGPASHPGAASITTEPL